MRNIFIRKNIKKKFVFSIVLFFIFSFAYSPQYPFNQIRSVQATGIAIVQTVKYQPTSTGSTVVITLGTSPTPGDVLVAFTSYSQYSVTRTLTAPDSSWTKVDDATYSYDSMSVWWHKVVAGDGTTYTFTISGSAEWRSGVMYELSGVDTATPINQHSIVTSASATSIATTGITPTVLNTMALAAADTDVGASGSLTSTVSSGWTMNQSAIPSYHTTFACERNSLTTDTTTSITTTFTFTKSSSGDVAAAILLNPAPTVTSPTVTTNSASSISVGTATLNGNITATGGANATIEGFASSTNSALSSGVATSSVSGSFGTGTFTGSMGGLTGNTTYYFRAYATNSGGTGYGSILNFLTLPDIPGTPTFSSINATNTTVSWTAPTGGASSYTMEVCSSSTSCNSYASISGTATTTYSLVGNTSYDYAVYGVNTTGNGAFSATSTQLTVPDVPSTPSAGSINSTSAVISWSAPTGGASSYKIERCTGSGCTSFSQIASGITSPYTDSTLSAATTYRYRVRATNATGDGLYSASSADITTLTIGISLTHFRWRTDNGTEISATYPLAQDTSVTNYLFQGDRIRLRFLVSNTGSGSATGYTYTLEQSSSTCTSWIPVPSYTNTGTANDTHWIMDLTSNIADGTPTTDQSALTDPSGGTFVAGYVESLDNTTPALTLGTNQFTELEYSIRSTGFADVGTNYCFRLTNNGSTTNFTYTTEPQATLTDIIYRPSGGGQSIGGEGNGSGPIINGGGVRDAVVNVEGSGSGPIITGGGPGGGGGGSSG